MTPIELKARREALGLDQSDLAALLGVQQATVSRWEAGKRTIPEAINGELNAFEDQLEEWIDLTAEMLDATTDRPVLLCVFATDEAFWFAHPEHKGVPALLHRVAMARARMFADDPNMTHLVEG